MIKKIVKENYKYLLTLLFLIILFWIIKYLNHFEMFEILDQSVSNFIKNNFSSKLDKIFNFTSDFIGIYTLIIIIVCMIFKFKEKIYIKLTGLSYIFTLAFTSISKIVIGRERPLMEVTATIDKYSFPSGHTIVSFVMYFFIAYLLSIKEDKHTSKAYYIIAFILVTTVAFSRLYLGVHYFTDVLGSLLFGTIILSMLINIVKKNYKRKLV